MSDFHQTFRPCAALALLPASPGALMAAEPAPPYVFTDSAAQVATPGVEGPVPCHIVTITVNGFGPRRMLTLTLTAALGAVNVLALCDQ